MPRLRPGRLIILTVLISFVCGFLLAYHLMNVPHMEVDGELISGESMDHWKLPIVQPTMKVNNKRGEEKNQPVDLLPEYNDNIRNSIDINYNMHIFYYAWYGNLQLNGAYLHWKHPRLPHWDNNIAKKYSTEIHNPPNDIGANFYPMLGLYSSANSSIVDQHMAMIRYTGIGVVIVSWYPPGLSDPNGTPVDHLIPMILNAADKYKLKIALHMEECFTRNATTLRKNIRYIQDHYSTHNAYYWRHSPRFGKSLPVIYFYDSYRLPVNLWKDVLLSPNILNLAPGPVYAVGLFFQKHNGDCNELARGGFSGAYTYFSSESVSVGSNGKIWPEIKADCESKNIEFFPSIGPGYLDTAVRPWNEEKTQLRMKGSFFRKRFWEGMQVKPAGFGITSFNEWHEGTQIEPAIPFKRGDDELNHRLPYHDYRPNSPYFYLRLTRHLTMLFTQHKRYHNVSIPSPD